jgi:hypothetical protein
MSRHALTRGLSITMFRYVPPDPTVGSEQVEAYLNRQDNVIVYTPTALNTGDDAMITQPQALAEMLLKHTW